jgi:hypothetical protein
MTHPGVWLTDFMFTSNNNYTGYAHCTGGDPRAATDEGFMDYVEGFRANRRGEAPPAEAFPVAYLQKWTNTTLPKKPVFQIFGFPIVTREAKELFEQFDIGNTQFHPTKIYEFGAKKLYPGEFFHLSLGATKRAFVPEETSPKCLIPGWDPPRYMTNFMAGDGAVAVTEAALKGYDLWYDPDLRNSVFLSQRLVDAIVAKKWKRWFFLTSCRVLPRS